jgi:hypothetical protein
LDPGTVQRDHDRLKKFIYPYIGARPVAAIEPPDLLQALSATAQTHCTFERKLLPKPLAANQSWSM